MLLIQYHFELAEPLAILSRNLYSIYGVSHEFHIGVALLGGGW